MGTKIENICNNSKQCFIFCKLVLSSFFHLQSVDLIKPVAQIQYHLKTTGPLKNNFVSNAVLNS